MKTTNSCTLQSFLLKLFIISVLQDFTSSPKNHELVYEFFDGLSAFNAQADGWSGYEESCNAPN
ncbi:MAG TPA: hypothetical protein ACFYD7_05540 [Candidatus Wujingus californicus]|uniref:hypothetical protein n=1 Tax=Candidatus Wujingus californicus TaxID=3367618 RepID=UPI001E058C6D|nr:hypothetical protein [Planctomycetota bacterium]MDO8132177.1 hypothetical protein [Candidatus Brocadiales bacterium]